jgi:hypothetical protein
MTRKPVPDDAERRAEGFVGRSWMADAVVEWLADRDAERYLLIVGEPGWGKTALAAWLAGAGPLPDDPAAADRLTELRRGWDALHFCVARGSQGTINAGQFARDLAEQLSAIDEFALAVLDEMGYEFDIRVEVRENWGQVVGARIDRLITTQQDPEDVYNRCVRQPLLRIAEQRRDFEVRILVDALDEAVTGNEPSIVSLIAGSGDLPGGVRFVLTSRDDQAVLDRFPRARILDLSDPAPAERSAGDLEAFVSDRLNAALDARPAPNGKITAAKLIERADGNFLYATWVLNGLASGEITDLTRLPNGLNGLYREYLERLLERDARPWDAWHEPFFGCLMVAAPVAPEGSLPRWLGWTDGDVNREALAMAQVLEFVDRPDEGDGGYRFYHRSFADFLTVRRYRDGVRSRPNQYYLEPWRQHDRIASYYLERGNGGWAGCDAYGLRQLVEHLKAIIDDPEAPDDRAVSELYRVARSSSFQRAQIDRLNGIHHRLHDLRTTLDVALARRSAEDLTAALRSVGAFRGITSGTGLSEDVFAAVVRLDIPTALRKMDHYRVGTAAPLAWQQVLQLYLAWEAAEAGAREQALELARPVTQPSPSLTTIADGLITRIALALAGEAEDPLVWMNRLGRERPQATALLRAYRPVVDPAPLSASELLSRAEAEVQLLEVQTSEGSVEAASAYAFAGDDGDAPVDAETAAGVTRSLATKLRGLLADAAGRRLVTRALRTVLRNPYPRYRDIALSAIGGTVVTAPDRDWVSDRLREILRAGLDDEGITFTFDLPTLLLAENDKRRLRSDGLRSFVEEALDREDVWGTRMRALSAKAAAAFRNGLDDPVQILLAASRTEVTYAGYGVTGVLELMDRCFEFGAAGQAHREIWGPARDRSLLDLAERHAERVHDPTFRVERRRLVEEYSMWAAEPEPDAATAQRELAAMADTDTRRAYCRHVAARWAASPEPAVARQVTALIPLALFDATLLDALLARLVALDVGELSDQDLSTLNDVVETNLATGRPWTFGQWR